MLSLLLLIFSVNSYAKHDDIELIVDRSDHRLYIRQNGHTLRSFKVALGSTRKAKEQNGDRATPTGNYKIQIVRDSDTFYKFIQINYPNMNDAKRGLKNHLISQSEYKAILNAHTYGRMPPQNTRLGGSIGIHGIGFETNEKIEIHEMSDWTKGCIAIRNSEIEQLSRYIEVGTPLKIVD
jgi:murein L,D-transpeptidase YafK